MRKSFLIVAWLSVLCDDVTRQFDFFLCKRDYFECFGIDGKLCDISQATRDVIAGPISRAIREPFEK